MHPAIEAFFPLNQAVLINTSVASANVQLPDRNRDENRQCQIANNSASWMFVKQGASNAVAATVDVDYAVAPGAVVVITLGNDTTWVAAILAAGAAASKAYFHVGEGIKP